MADSQDVCTLFDEQGKCTAVIAIRKFMASISLVGCVFMMVVIWLLSKYTAFAQRLILYLTIAAFLSSIGFLMAAVKPEGPVCTFEGFWLTFSDWSVLLWVLVITINLYLNAVQRIETGFRHEILYCCIAWLVPLFVACLPFIGHRYGPAGAWCWIEKGEDAWRFGIWYIPLFLIIAAMFTIYLIIIYKVNREGGRWFGTYNPDNQRYGDLLRAYVKPLKVYPIVFLILAIFPLINRLQNAISRTGDPVFVLTLLHASTSALLGFVNAVVYGLDPETRSHLTWRGIHTAIMKKRRKTIIREYSTSEKTAGGVTNIDGFTLDSDMGNDQGDPTSRSDQPGISIVSDEYKRGTRSWYLGDVFDE